MRSLTQQLFNTRQLPFGLNNTTAVLLTIWFCAMTAVPIAIWTIGDQTIPTTMLLGVITQAIFVFVVLAQDIGLKNTAVLFSGIALMGWGLEAVGTQTGLPFGVYSYTGKLQPQLFHVPLLIPLAWFMMMPVAWSIAQSIVGKSSLLTIPAAAAAMTAWDLFLDPQMVGWEFWVWANPGQFSYFGIPWLNYFGWFIGSALITAVFYPFQFQTLSATSQKPLWLIYALTCFFETFGLLLFWQLPGPALIGGLVMGYFAYKSYS